jgi:aminopeptidase N
MRTGAPTLKLSNVDSHIRLVSKYEISFTLSQIQKEEPFTVKIPVAVYDEEKVVVKDFTMTQREEKFIISCDKAPVRIDIDPQFNVMRRLRQRGSAGEYFADHGR